MDITVILELMIKLIFAVLTIFVVPKLKALISEKVAESDQKKIIRWVELAVQAAEEAERSGLIDSTCWELFNQFKKDSDSGTESEA